MSARPDVVYDDAKYAAVPGWRRKDSSPDLEEAIVRARNTLLSLQQPEGHWVFEFEADCTIPAETILLRHYMDEVDEHLEEKLAVYLRSRQADHGGWPLYYGGELDLSCSVKTYYALKLVGDSPDEPHMVAARKAILAHGGAARSNVFTRITLALFGQIPWRGVPFIPVEVMFLPRWFPFHLDKVAYWSRVVMVPLFILCSLKPRARNPRGVDIRELFTTPPEVEKDYFPIRSPLNRVFLAFDRVGRLCEPLIPRFVRNRALRKAEAWFVERLNGTDGLGAIFPAMVNAYEAMDCLGYARDHPRMVAARKALSDLLVERADSAYCQPCVSPVWDTGLAAMALQEEGSVEAEEAAERGLDWLQARQLRDEPGDWRRDRPDLPGGGWPFQFGNAHYPDLDDTAVVAWAMDQAHTDRYWDTVARAANWLQGMQSRNGGFAAYDADNTYYYLNEIPFADHGALLDPPTSDVTARCAALFARLDGPYKKTLDASIEYLRGEQEASGAWFGRWGTNYIYGTWSVLVALELAGVDSNDVCMRRAVQWLKSKQRQDGGWGETNDTYFDLQRAGESESSTSFHTAWALLGLMAAGEVESTEVGRGVEYLVRTQTSTGLWAEPEFNAPGFPRVFYLKYHGYSTYFPLWALTRYRNLRHRGIP